MENFFDWMVKVIPQDEVNIWFNIHNMHYEKIELYGDIFKTLYQIIVDTYLGYETTETKIALSTEDKIKHFEWCWNKLLFNFKEENISLNEIGEHKDYLKSFFLETFYSSYDKKIHENIPKFISSVFDTTKEFSKSDLDILTEIYKLLEKNIRW
jgi:hypothetical protein